jgi:bifunctional DNase/RNase
MEPVEVVGVRMEMPSNTPIVLLRQTQGSTYLPIWVGAVEATAIAFAQQGIVPPRPLTHDLMVDLLTALDVGVQRIEITALTDGVFYAQVILSNDVTVSARPSDAIALALRVEAPIFADPEVLAEAGIELPEEAPADEEVERFREFLDQVSPEDFMEPGTS